MLRQIEWKVQHGPITKDGILPVTTLFFWKFCFKVRTSSKELIRYTSYPNAHIHTFCKRWSFIWSFICFFPVSIFKQTCIFQLHIFLSMYDLLVDTKRQRVTYRFQAGIYLVKVNNGNTKRRCEMFSKLITKTSERRQWCRSGVFIVNFEHISQLVIVFLMLTLNM